MAANDINRPSLVLLLSLIVPAMLACLVAYYLATMRLEPATGVVPTMPVVITGQTPIVPVLDDRVTGVPVMPPAIPSVTPVLINSTMIYAPASDVTVYIPLVTR